MSFDSDKPFAYVFAEKKGLQKWFIENQTELDKEAISTPVFTYHFAIMINGESLPCNRIGLAVRINGETGYAYIRMRVFCFNNGKLYTEDVNLFDPEIKGDMSKLFPTYHKRNQVRAGLALALCEMPEGPVRDFWKYAIDDVLTFFPGYNHTHIVNNFYMNSYLSNMTFKIADTKAIKHMTKKLIA